MRSALFLLVAGQLRDRSMLRLQATAAEQHRAEFLHDAFRGLLVSLVAGYLVALKLRTPQQCVLLVRALLARAVGGRRC